MISLTVSDYTSTKEKSEKKETFSSGGGGEGGHTHVPLGQTVF